MTPAGIYAQGTKNEQTSFLLGAEIDSDTFLSIVVALGAGVARNQKRGVDEISRYGVNEDAINAGHAIRVLALTD